MDIAGIPTGTTVLNTLVGLFCLYLFYGIAIRVLVRKEGWQSVSNKMNIALVAVIWLLVFGPFGLSGDPHAGQRLAWIVAITVFGLLALWNMLWVTFTKKAYPPFAPIAYGVTLGIYASLFIVFVFGKATFNFSA